MGFVPAVEGRAKEFADHAGECSGPECARETFNAQNLIRKQQHSEEASVAGVYPRTTAFACQKHIVPLLSAARESSE